MHRFIFGGILIMGFGLTTSGFSQNAPVTRNLMPPPSGFSVYPKPMKATIPKSRMLRKKGNVVAPATKKNGFIPLYPNGKPTPVANLKILNLPKSAPATVLAPRNLPYSSLYQDPR